MKRLKLWRAVATTACAAVFPVACVSPPTNGLPQATRSWTPNGAAPLSAKGLIYAFGSFKHSNGAILDYPSGKFVSAFTTPRMGVGGVCSDTHGNVFAGGETISALPVIQEYAYGATSPTTTVTFSSNGGVTSCTVDRATADVAAVVEFGPSQFAVVVLPHFTGKPKGYQDSSMQILLSAGYDGSGNLFLLGADTNHSYALAELPKGGKSFKAIALDLGSHNGGVKTVAWDGSHVTIEGVYDAGRDRRWPQIVYQLKIAGTKGSVVKTTSFQGFDSKKPAASCIQSNIGIMAIAAGTIHSWKYPAGGKQISNIHTGVGSTYTATLAAPASR